jgi:hypothetical protein
MAFIDDEFDSDLTNWTESYLTDGTAIMVVDATSSITSVRIYSGESSTTNFSTSNLSGIYQTNTDSTNFDVRIKVLESSNISEDYGLRYGIVLYKNSDNYIYLIKNEHSFMVGIKYKYTSGGFVYSGGSGSSTSFKLERPYHIGVGKDDNGVHLWFGTGDTPNEDDDFLRGGDFSEILNYSADWNFFIFANHYTGQSQYFIDVDYFENF